MAALAIASTSSLAIWSLPAAAALAFVPFAIRPLIVLQTGLPYNHTNPVRADQPEPCSRWQRIPAPVRAHALMPHRRPCPGAQREMLDSKAVAELTDDQQKWVAVVRRCNYTHQNGLEGFPIFASAVLAAVVTGVPAPTIERAALVYLASRACYTAVYIGTHNIAFAFVRTALWTTGIGACATLFIAAARRAH